MSWSDPEIIAKIESFTDTVEVSGKEVQRRSLSFFPTWLCVNPADFPRFWRGFECAYSEDLEVYRKFNPAKALAFPYSLSWCLVMADKSVPRNCVREYHSCEDSFWEEDFSETVLEMMEMAINNG